MQKIFRVKTLRVLIITITSGLVLSSCSHTLKDSQVQGKDESTNTEPDRSPASNLSCHKLIQSLWEQGPPHPQNQHLSTRERLITKLNLQEDGLKKFRQSPTESQKELSELFNRQIASELPAEQQEYAAGLTLLIQKRHSDLSAQRIIQHYQKIMRSCINS